MTAPQGAITEDHWAESPYQILTLVIVLVLGAWLLWYFNRPRRQKLAALKQ